MPEPKKLRVPIPIRFADIDALGHVNNAVYLSYLEIARFALWVESMGFARLEDIDFLLARVEIDFKRPVQFEDELSCLVWVASIGRTSFTAAYEFVVGDAVVAAAKSVQVFVDLKSGTPKPVTDAFREGVRAYVE